MAKDEIMVLNPLDNVGVALSHLRCGTRVRMTLGGEPREIMVKDDVPSLHKVSLYDIKQRGEIFKHGHVIGRATQEILSGMHVHTHNLVDDYGGAL